MPREFSRGIYRPAQSDSSKRHQREATQTSRSSDLDAAMGSRSSESTSASASASASERPVSPSSPPMAYQPSPSDVVVVRTILQRATSSPAAPLGLPPELVDIVVDTAEYWPSMEVKLDRPVHIRQDGDQECLRTKPLCYDTVNGSGTLRLRPHRDHRPCRKVDFTISSHDQGWGGGPGTRGTYNGSFTWFDAFIIPMQGAVDSAQTAFREVKKDVEEPKRKAEKTEIKDSTRGKEELAENPNECGDEDGGGEQDDGDDDDDDQDPETRQLGSHNYDLPSAQALQRNIVARSRTETHSFTWHCLDSIDPDSEDAQEIQNAHGRGRATLDGRTVRAMNVGDAISVWGRARFPGWQNMVEGMSIRVFWAI